METKINRQRLVEMFKNFHKEITWSGCSFAGITYFTDEAQSRTINKEKALQKLVTVRITVGSNYSDKVNRILKKQEENPNFVAQEQKGKFYPYGTDTPIVASEKDPSKEMLVMICEHNAAPQVTYFHKGNVIDKEEAKAKDLFTPSFFAEKETAGRGAVEENSDFHFRTLGFQKIIKLNIAGQEFVIED